MLRALFVAALGATMVATPAMADQAPSVTGVVVLAGNAVEGAVVTLTPLHGLDGPDGPYRQAPVATATTGTNGTFSLPLQATPDVMALSTRNGGFVNYALRTFYNPAVSTDLGTAFGQAGGTAFGATDLVYTQVIGTGATTPAEEAAGAVLATPDPVTLELTAMGAVAGAESVVENPGSEDAQCRSQYGPIVTVLARENSLDPVGEVHTNYDMTAKFDYGEQANTDLNGAYSFGGGPWKVTVNASRMANKKTLVGATYGPFESFVVRTVFKYRKEKLEYTDDMGDGRVCRTDYDIIPEGWTGGTWQDGADVRSKDSFAQMDAARAKEWAMVFGRGAHFVKNTSRGHKYHTGVVAFGIGLYARSMWSNQVDIRYTFGTETSEHWLYGANGSPPDAKNVYAW